MLPARAPAFTTILVVTAGIAVVAVLAMLVRGGLTGGFDGAIIGAVRDPAARDLFAPLRVVTELGSTGGVTIVAGVTLVVGIAIGPWRHGLAGAVTIALAALANSALKIAIARERPDLLEPSVVEHGFSFPSGHSALGMVAYGILAVLVGRSRLAAPVRAAVILGLGVVVALIGLSRIWLGVHYPTDVIAGWTAGAIVVVLYATLTRRVSPEPAAAAVDADPEGPRSDRPAPG